MSRALTPPAPSSIQGAIMQTAYIVTDLGYGDAGKGSTVDYLARQAGQSLIVRHNGGAQAAHNVVTPEGRHHTFSQFGSGSFVKGTETFLSRYMLVSPSAMLNEGRHLSQLGVFDIWQRLYIDEQAPIILPWHGAAVQLRELARGATPHGSVGIGISEVMRDTLDHPEWVVRAGDLKRMGPELFPRLLSIQKGKFYQLLKELTVPDSEEARKAWSLLREPAPIEHFISLCRLWVAMEPKIVDGGTLQPLADTVDTVLFEGSQGVLLDEWFGFHPYTTWSTTTSENAERLLGELNHTATITRLGLVRAYTTRHGHGPFVTETPALAQQFPELHNDFGRWTGAFRYGHLDLLAHRYAVEATRGVDQLVVSGLDRANVWQYAHGYVTPETPDINDFFQRDDDGIARSIVLAGKDELDRQERLTQLLMQCSPFYTQDPVSGDELLTAIEAHLGAPVTLASYGPRATDKRAVDRV